jgi:hypothetical protein
MKDISFGRYGKKRKCKCQKNRKQLPYGYKSDTGYCSICDIGTELKVSKKNARSKVRLEILKELIDER